MKNKNEVRSSPREDQSRRADLLCAAAHLMRLKGYAATTIRDMANAVGMGSGSPFCHFRNKQEILNEVTLRGNRAAFERIRFAPRVLRDVAEVDAATEILGGPSKYPLVIAPVGGIGMGWPGGDLAIARAAASYGIPFTLSTAATVSIEEIADKAPGRLWFQLYVLHDRDFTDRLVERAGAAGYEALVVTVDLPVGGKRERDTHNGLILPFRPGWREMLAGIAHPSWALRIAAAGGIPELVNMRGLAGRQRADMMSTASSVGQQHDASFDDRGLARLRDMWKRKLIVKGVSRATIWASAAYFSGMWPARRAACSITCVCEYLV